MATNEEPFTGTPGAGGNTLAVDFDFGTGGTEAAVDLGTFGNGGGKKIESYNFVNGWTMVCAFRARDLDNWQVAMGKDGKRVLGPEQPFSFKQVPDAETFGICCLILRDDDNFDYREIQKLKCPLPLLKGFLHSRRPLFNRKGL